MADLDLEPDIRNQSRNQTLSPPAAPVVPSTASAPSLNTVYTNRADTATDETDITYPPSPAKPSPSILNDPEHILSVDQHAHFTDDEHSAPGVPDDEKSSYPYGVDHGGGHHALVTSIQSIATRSNPELGSPELSPSERCHPPVHIADCCLFTEAQRNVHAARRRPMPVLHLDDPALRPGIGLGPPRPPKSFAQVLKPDRKLAKDPTWATSFKVRT
jgi:hypothetical protein